MHATFRTGVTAALCAAAAATTFAGNASAGPIGIASAVIKAPSATEQIYYRRYGGRYYRNGYAYGPRYYYGRPAYGYGYGYGYGYPYAYPVVPVPLPVPFFGW
jgi:hypothetical protein